MKFTPRNEKTRQFIIESTADVFNKKGFAGTSLTDLTEATQLTKGSIYGNFENKEEVALAVLDYNIEQRSRAMETAVAQAGTYREKLLVYSTFFSKQEKTLFPKGGCPYLNAGLEADDTNEALRQKVATALLHWKKRMATLVVKGIEAGEFKKDTNAETMAISLIALVEGGIFMSSVTKDKRYTNTITETAAILIALISN